MNRMMKTPMKNELLTKLKSRDQIKQMRSSLADLCQDLDLSMSDQDLDPIEVDKRLKQQQSEQKIHQVSLFSSGQFNFLASHGISFENNLNSTKSFNASVGFQNRLSPRHPNKQGQGSKEMTQLYQQETNKLAMR